MLKGQDIICISSIDWDFIWQGHQEIMATFAKNGNRVLFIENTGVRSPSIRDIPRIRSRIRNWLKGFKGIRKEMENLFVYSPLVLPFPYSRLARVINRYLLISSLKRWMRIVDFSDPIIWTFLPTPISLDIINSINNKLVVYYCIAEFEHLVRDSKKIKKSEVKLIKRADIIFAQGKVLERYCRQFNENISVFPFGVNLKVFEEYFLSSHAAPEDIKNLPRPIFGYIGGLHKHIDFNLIEYMAKNNPVASIVLVGPDQVGLDLARKYKNIYMLGKKSHADLPSYIKEFDVCLIPYMLSEYTKTVYPTKLNEYLIMGKPVVSTKLPEMAEFSNQHKSVIYVAEDYEDFNRLSNDALREKDLSLANKRIEIAKANSWDRRIDQMSEIMQVKIDQKMASRDKWWKENLSVIYKRARKSAIKYAAISILLYILVFKTGFVWFLAGPLKISEPPVKSDVIVVVAAGIGESGKPGQGYEERVSYAVKLYKEGYAKKLIFASGYTYAIKEADIMNVLAISLGVPADSIMLETKATTAYQNITFLIPILKQNNFKSALLVSTPYNMRRLELLWAKNMDGIKMTCTPIPRSLFYGDGSIVKVDHIKAIMHEYLGIVYYWFKGFI